MLYNLVLGKSTQKRNRSRQNFRKFFTFWGPEIIWDAPTRKSQLALKIISWGWSHLSPPKQLRIEDNGAEWQLLKKSYNTKNYSQLSFRSTKEMATQRQGLICKVSENIPIFVGKLLTAIHQSSFLETLPGEE